MRTKKYNINSGIYFIVAAILIAYFFPREGKFRYQFYEGKPWRYGLLTAPSDFPIYKTDAQVQAEKDSILKQFEPYFQYNASVEKQQINKFDATYNSQLKNHVPASYRDYIEKSLHNLYTFGIISSEDMTMFQKNGFGRVNLVKNNIATAKFSSEFFTIKTAYEFIIDNCPRGLNSGVLQSCDINNYLMENVAYDEKTSDKVKGDIINSIPLAQGMVQAGERIVDRGEIVDAQTYSMLRSLKIVHEAKAGGAQRNSLILGGQFILVLGLMLCFWLYLYSFRRTLLSTRFAFFLVFCIFVTCILTEIVSDFSLFNIYILPYAIVPIVVRTFFDSRTALFTHLVAVLICSLMVPFPHEFLFLQIISGMVVTFSLRDLYERSQLIRCTFFVFLTYAIGYIGISIFQDADFSKINWMMMLYFGINFILLMFSYILVYILEKAFGFVSSITLVELSNIDAPILKKLSETCPGTFQHSIQVSNLASEAADKIGANTRLVRTGALYHDIGKMSNPIYFIENQDNYNPHQNLPFEESAQIIISHVPEGVKRAEKAGLPNIIIDFIRTHHGKGKTKYFYNSFKNKYPDRPVDESIFTYPGPNPSTKETTIVMMADSVEAASRSMKSHSDEDLKTLVNTIIDRQFSDGMLKEAPLTFKEVEEIKTVFIEMLKKIYHTRISYPDLNEKAKAESKTAESTKTE